MVGARRDAEELLSHALGVERQRLLSSLQDPATEALCGRFEVLVERRAAREPLQYILGTWDFYGRPFEVSPAVLIPRPETEGLVEAVLARLPSDAAVVVDVGAGSGAIAVTLAIERPGLVVYATDLSQAALAVAAANARQHGVEQRLRFLPGHLLDPLHGALRKPR